MNIFVTTSNVLYSKPKAFSAKCALKFGKFDKVLVYDNDKDMDDEFKERNKDILSLKLGAGLWLWKVYFIRKALMECSEGDVLFYLDAAGFFFRSVKPIIDVMNDDIFAVSLPYIEEEFTKKETFEIMGLIGEEYKKTNQFQASYMAFRKSKRSVQFIDEWYDYAQNVELISPFHNVGDQEPSFCMHRMDQSIFSLLCKKYGVKTHSEVTQFRHFGYPYVDGASYSFLDVNSEYPITIWIHRLKDFPSLNGIIKCIKGYCAYIVKQKFKISFVIDR